MPKRFILLLALCGLCLGARAAVLPPEKLLPRDTVLVVTMPDSIAAWAMVTNSSYGRLWADPALKPFKDKFIAKFTNDFLAPLQRNLNLSLSDYQGLAQGQATFALVPVTLPDKPEQHVAKIFLLDTKGGAARLRTNLAAIRQKWAAAGKPMQARKIRDVDFTTLMLSAADMDKLLTNPGADQGADKTSGARTELTFGQVDSLLLVSDAAPAIEKVLSRQAGGLVPGLDENPLFQSDFAARLHGAPFYAWANLKSFIDIMTKIPAADADDAGANPAGPMLTSTGLDGLTSACFTYRSLPEGMAAQLFVGVPESKRHGIFSALAPEPRYANPPPFVPADTMKFWRWRVNISQGWTELEKMLNNISPQYGSVINYILQTAGKSKDEKYDLKSELLSNLGDDIIHYEKPPQGDTLADLNAPPSLYLIGSPNAENLAIAVKTGLSFLGPTKDREFLGRQVYTLSMIGPGGAPGKSFSFAGSGGYLALSDNTDILEEFLRSGGNQGKTLADTPGLADAAQQVGGMGTGLFGFENDNLAMRGLFDVVHKQSLTWQDILGQSAALGVNPGDNSTLQQWFDFSLLPPYDAVSQYFYFSVFAGRFSPDGFTLNFFSPTPPKLR